MSQARSNRKPSLLFCISLPSRNEKRQTASSHACSADQKRCVRARPLKVFNSNSVSDSEIPSDGNGGYFARCAPSVQTPESDKVCDGGRGRRSGLDSRTEVEERSLKVWIDKSACRSTGSMGDRDQSNHAIDSLILGGGQGKIQRSKKRPLLKTAPSWWGEKRDDNLQRNFSSLQKNFAVAFLILGFATTPPRQFHSLSRREEGGTCFER